jgi:hypothetical protein
MSNHPITVLSCGVVLLAALGCGASADPPSTHSDRQALGNTKGSGGDMPAYYDAKIFTINFSELPPGGESSTLNKNGQINNIYQCDACEANGFMFVSVIDAVPADGMNPLWQEVQITFAAGATMTQFTSDDQVLDAAAAGTIKLTNTGEMYRCSVVGTKSR